MIENKKILKILPLAFGTFTAVGFISYFSSMKWLKVKQVKINVPNLPEGLRQLRILHISDLHNNSQTKISLDIWKTVFKECFDVAMITGDMTREYFEQILPHEKQLKRLADSVPTFFTDGNHEISHYGKMKFFLKNCGITVLENKKVRLSIKGDILEIIGLRDYTTHNKDNFKSFNKLMKDEPSDGFRVVLSHQPQMFDKLGEFQDLLVLSGHTHGGQVRLPFIPAIYAPGQGFWPQYGDGLFYRNTSVLYISKGIGATRFPIRFFNRPEFAVIELSNNE